MRGNWSTGGDPVGAPTGQQINVEHRDLPHSPATPAWNIADRIVKEEQPEDKNNDSGVSPGHYTSNSVSPRSRRSSSTANGSLSPGSATSQDSNAMQYEYSPQRIFKNCVSPIGFSSHPNGARSPKLSAGYPDDINQGNTGIQETEQPVDMVSSTVKQDSDDSEAMQCPVCPFSTVHRMQFNEHLAAHCSSKCDISDFSGSSYGQLSSLSEDGARGSPSQGDRSEHEFDETDEPGLRIPRVNCQGKVKTFRCKQCNFVAITKLEFWEHSRGHIKAEKLLTCPKCPFVTEYKHHLEYHLRNHFGSKPFKCDKCPYSCVNKSMLNSHLKSHSNVYQYRCAECSYATKYCHSLKLHLRKYAHKPAMVLNPDGSPNPLPIIDIYGTRRGPKQKPANNKSGPDQDSASQVVSMVSPGAGIPGKPLMMMQGIPPVIGGLGSPFTGDHHALQAPQINVPFPFNQILNAVSGMPGNFLQHQHQQFHNHRDSHNENNNVDNRKQEEAGFKSSFQFYEAFNHREKMNDFIQRESTTTTTTTAVAEFPEDPKPPLELTTEIETPTQSSIASPLDLSKPELSQNSTTNSPRTGGTSRRKGRAFKLNKLVVAHDSEDESFAQLDETPKSQDMDTEVTVKPEEKDEITSGSASDYNCQYCDIAFGNVLMYTMHMGYHGYKNPYTCNMCGHECADKVSFFLHIARSSHS